MSAAILQKLIEAGTPPALIAEVAAAIATAEAETRALRVAAEARLSKDRLRKRGIPSVPRNSTEIPENLARAEPPLTTSETNKNKNPPSPPSGAQTPTRFSGKTPLPADWQPDEELIAYAETCGHDRAAALAIGEDMRVWAHGKGEKRSDWRATYQSFCRRDAKAQRSRAPPKGSGLTGHYAVSAALEARLAARSEPDEPPLALPRH